MGEILLVKSPADKAGRPELFFSAFFYPFSVAVKVVFGILQNASVPEWMNKIRVWCTFVNIFNRRMTVDPNEVCGIAVIYPNVAVRIAAGAAQNVMSVNGLIGFAAEGFPQQNGFAVLTDLRNFGRRKMGIG